MNASNLSNLNTTITHLGVVLEGFKESMMYTSASQRFQEQVQKLQINHVNNELDKTRESLTSLRLRLVHTDASLDAALTAAEQMDERARRTAFANEALMNNFQKQNTLADKRMETAQNKKAAAHAMMNIAQEKMADANEMMKIAQKMNADADERFKVAQAKIDAAVGLQDQADVALVTLEQNIARGDEHSTEVVETLRQVFELQKLQKIKMEAEVAKQLETKEFEVRMMKRWNECESINNLKQAKIEKSKWAYTSKSTQTDGPQKPTGKACLPVDEVYPSAGDHLALLDLNIGYPGAV